ncbi:serine hydrolase [Clostridia bacterium]|nr:serine hydrolase [Clostridia bacterium]
MEHLELLDDYLDEYIKKWDFYGVVCVAKSGEIVVQKAAGFSSREFDVPNTSETRFTLGSMSKQFTAFAIMQLFDRGEIELGNSANRYLPDNLQIDSRITVHQLLSHTSGLHNFYNFDEDFFGSYNRNSYCKQEYFDLFINAPLDSVPGTKFGYNNSNFNLLAWIVENLSGKPFDQYLSENIFAPLDMRETELDFGTNIIKNKAFPYDFHRDLVVRCQYYNEKFNIGCGAIVSNCVDLLKWNSCLKQRQLLSMRAYTEFFKCNLSDYCYGLERKTIYGKQCYAHGGDHLGVMTYMLNFFDEDICVIILSNAGFGNQYKIGNSICDILFTGEYAKSTQPKTVILTDEEIKKYEGVYLDRKIELRLRDNKWEFIRFNVELHIPLRPIGNHQFIRTDCDQYQPYTLIEREDGNFEFFGYLKKR